MVIAFGLGGVAYWLLGTLGHEPWAFVFFAALIFLTWGEIFSLFPVDLHRYLRHQVRHRQFEPALHRQRRVGVPGADRQSGQRRDRQLAHGVRRHRDHELRGGRLGAVRAQAAAGANDGSKLIAATRSDQVVLQHARPPQGPGFSWRRMRALWSTTASNVRSGRSRCAFPGKFIAYGIVRGCGIGILYTRDEFERPHIAG